MSTDRRRDRITDLGELQLQVLDILSAMPEGSVEDVLQAFPDAERPRYTTIATVLRSLERKGLATHRADGRTYIYHVTVPSDQVRQSVLGDVLMRVFRGSPRALVASLLDTAAVTPEVMDELRSLVEERAESDDGG